MKEVIANLLVKSTKLKKEEIDKLIEIPPSVEMGDYAFPCFSLAGKFKRAPNQIALEIKEKLVKLPSGIKEVKVLGAYVNFFVDNSKIAENLIKEILKKKNDFGKSNVGKGKKIVIEFPSPNTNKPLHLGHLRNMALGESISRILELIGGKVYRVNLNNDRGVHICKSMLAYKEFGKNKSPNKKSDHFVGDFYVKFNELAKKDESYDEKAQELLRKWENGDRETIALWKKMNKWALDGFKKTYKNFGIKHDKEYFESKIYKEGKKIILDGLRKGLFEKKQDGSIYVNLEKEKLGEKILLRKDGTAVYITQDIYLAKLKKAEFKFDKSFYVVGNEQEYHFQVLFSILKKLGFNSESLKHISYGMVELPEGKMKSREGNVIDADNLIEEITTLAKEELNKRAKLSKKEVETRGNKISLAAIKYFLLKIDSKRNMLFNPNEAMNFEGNTGPYLLYSYARANSILRKSLKKNTKLKVDNLNSKEEKLVKKLSEFPEIVLNSYKSLNPSLIANYSYQLAQIFNEFYHACPVIGDEKENFRILLVKSFKQVLKNSLSLIGIETLEEM